MIEPTEAVKETFRLGPGPSRVGALVDILIYVAAGLVFYGIEEALRAADRFPFPGVFDGGMTLVASFFVVVALMKWRGQSWPAFGLKRPERWWTIPVWGLVIIVVNIVGQLAVVPLLAALVKAPAPDLSRYNIIYQNLPMLLIVMPGAMITGGFIEEFIYRGMMIDRLGRAFGGGRRGLILAALLNGVPFGLIHFEWGFGGMLVTTVMGSILGIMYLVTKRNLWPLIAAHASLDAILMLQVYYAGIG
jgi:membrane protease YdiL (CAAX protease family)